MKPLRRMRLAVASAAIAAVFPAFAQSPTVCLTSTRSYSPLYYLSKKLFINFASEDSGFPCHLEHAVIDVGAGNTLSPNMGGALDCALVPVTFQGSGTSKLEITWPGAGLRPTETFAVCITDTLGEYWNSGQTIQLDVACGGIWPALSATYDTTSYSATTPPSYGSTATLGACGVSDSTLGVQVTFAPVGDAGRFTLSVDGETLAQVNAASAYAESHVAPGAHRVQETALAGSGTTMADYLVSYGGDCDADGNVSLGAGGRKVCTVTNTRLPTLTVTKSLSPATAAARFSLLIDGRVRAKRVGNGGTTGPVRLRPGAHWIAELPVEFTPQSGPLAYAAAIGGDCRGWVVQLAPGEVKTCTVTNARRQQPLTPAACQRECKHDAQVCTEAARQPGGPPRAVCERLKKACPDLCR